MFDYKLTANKYHPISHLVLLQANLIQGKMRLKEETTG